MPTLADNCPETVAIRIRINEAIENARDIFVRYGRGSNPGTERTIRPLRFLDEDLFEGIQIAPEKRTSTQAYRSSCILSLQNGDQTIANPAAYEKCRGAIDYSDKSKKLDARLAEIESFPKLNLPKNLTRMNDGCYLWDYSYGKQPVLLKAPSDQAIASFVALANATAVEDWGGRTWVVIDAMFKYHIDWPAWYRYGLHLEGLIESFVAAGNSSENFECELPNVALDWPGFFNLDPFKIAVCQKPIGALYASLAHVPSAIMLAYIHDVRPQITEYYRSAMTSFTDEQVGLLNEYGLAEKQKLEHMIETTSIEDMRQVLDLCKIPIPPMKRRRAPYVEMFMSHAQSNPKVIIALRRKRRTQFILPPAPLNWNLFHDLRSQVIQMGRLLYGHLNGATEHTPVVSQMLSR